jgi:hypothetical protein
MTIMKRSFIAVILCCGATAFPALADATDSLAVAELARPVSLEAKRLPLPAVLESLEKQSGVALRLPANSPFAEKQITARIANAPLGEIMRSLRRLYGMRWERLPDGAWSALSSDNADLESQLLRVGDTARFENQNNVRPAKTDWFNNALAHRDASLLKSEGITFSALPEKAQQQAKNACQGIAGLRLVCNHAAAIAAALETDWLLCNVPRAAAPLLSLASLPTEKTSALQLSVVANNGRPVAPLPNVSSAEPPRNAPRFPVPGIASQASISPRP